MNNQLSIYADPQSQISAYKELIIFGIEVLKRAVIIEGIETLKHEKKLWDQGNQKEISPDLQKFIFEYLMDTVRITVFYENYMKAELIKADFCVHNIDWNNPAFKPLSKEQQKKRPVTLKEINAIEPFKYDKTKNELSHPALTINTINLKTLLCSSEYSKWYRLDMGTITWLNEIRIKRNQLHLNNELEFNLSEGLILNLENTIAFSDKLAQELITT